MNNTFNILDFGAIDDGKTNNAAAIQKAVDAASKVCGKVVIPGGNFLSGTIILKSDVELHLEKGAYLISSLAKEDILDFAELFSDDNLDTGWDGGCFLFALHEKNITISGEGTIYGQGDLVFFDDNTDGGFHECPLNVTAFRPRTTFLEDVENLVIKDITIKDAAFWTLHMAGCRNVRVCDIKILNDVRGANNDGIDPDCCQDVIITNCLVKTGDDAIVVKSTKPMTEKYGSCENILISNCILYSHDSALKIGTETHGHIRNVTLSDCIIKDCSRGIGIWVRDGATIEGIHIHHISGNTLKYADSIRESGPTMWWGNGEPLFISATPRKGASGVPGKIKNVTFDNVNMKAESSIFIGGEENSIIANVSLSNIHITMSKQGTQGAGFFDEQPSGRHVYKHSIPAVYARYCRNLYIDGSVSYEKPYNSSDNKLFELDHCYNEEIELKNW